MSESLKEFLDLVKLYAEQALQSTEVSPEAYIEFGQELTQHMFSLSEYKADLLSIYLTKEAERKREYFLIKNKHISEGKKVGESEALAEIEIFDKRVEEANAHSDYVKVREIHSSVDKTLTLLSQKTKLLTQEKRLTGNAG
jgi:hypothetical protein